MAELLMRLLGPVRRRQPARMAPTLAEQGASPFEDLRICDLGFVSLVALRKAREG